MSKIDLLKEISFLESKLKAKENAIHVFKMQNLDLYLKLEKYKSKIDLLKEISFLESKLKAKENAIHVLKMQNLDLYLKLDKYKRKNKKR